jgi:hypothetical protein
MELKWEIFEDGPAIQTTEHIHVTINRRCHIYLNGRTLAALGEPDAVVMMYDRRQQVIGIQRSPLDRRSAYRLRRKDRDRNGKMLYATNFCRRYHINPEKTLAFTNAEVDKNGVLVLSMHDVRTLERKPRRRA